MAKFGALPCGDKSSQASRASQLRQWSGKKEKPAENGIMKAKRKLIMLNAAMKSRD